MAKEIGKDENAQDDAAKVKYACFSHTCELLPLVGKKWFEQWRIVATLSVWK